jgi:hypothetical protein
MPAQFLNRCIWNASGSGTADFVVGSAAQNGYLPSQVTNPAVVTGTVYHYFAVAADGTHEEGDGAYTVATSTLARTVIRNSSAAGAKVNFGVAPIVTMGAPIASDFVILRGFLSGLTLSTAGSSATFTVAAGMAADSTNFDYVTLAASINKTTSAWAVGSGNGALDTGTIAATTWYHVHLIKNPTTLVVDVLVSLSATAPTMPSGYTLFRRIGSLLCGGTSQWTAFVQLGDEFLFKAPVQIKNGELTSTTAQNMTMTVPSGVQVWAKFKAESIFSTAVASTVFYSPDMGTQTTQNGFIDMFSAAANSTGPTAGDQGVRTNTSAQVQYVSNAAGALIYVYSYGWIDTRGKLA